MTTPGQSLLTIFELAYPPISNQEALWLRDSKAAEEIMRRSDFYMIGVRPEAFFTEFANDTKSNTISFNVCIGEKFREPVTIAIDELETVRYRDLDFLNIDLGPKVVLISDARSSHDSEEGLIDWFTTERLLWARQNGYPGIIGLDGYAQALTFELLYIGIARTGDSFDRLIRRAHLARQDILSNEQPRSAGSRVTDEVVLFLFAASNQIEINMYAPGDTIRTTADRTLWPHKRVIADAEKAFVSLLQPPYNKEKFRRYPEGVDGLFGSGLLCYGYTIGECITMSTVAATFRGWRNLHSSMPSDHADTIIVSEDSVEFVKGDSIDNEL